MDIICKFFDKNNIFEIKFYKIVNANKKNFSDLKTIKQIDDDLVYFDDCNFDVLVKFVKKNKVNSISFIFGIENNYETNNDNHLQFEKFLSDFLLNSFNLVSKIINSFSSEIIFNFIVTYSVIKKSLNLNNSILLNVLKTLRKTIVCESEFNLKLIMIEQKDTIDTNQLIHDLRKKSNNVISYSKLKLEKQGNFYV